MAFLPALWASIAATPHRERILRVTTVATIVLAAVGVLGFGVGFALLMAPTASLLAIAAGLVFQGGKGR